MQKGTTQYKCLGEQKSVVVLFNVSKAAQFSVCKVLPACQMRYCANSWKKELHLFMLSCEEKVTSNFCFCFVDEQVVMGNKLLVYIR